MRARFFHEVPRGWEQAVGAVAYVFHFPPGDIMAMEVEELRFWIDRAAEIKDKERRRG